MSPPPKNARAPLSTVILHSLLSSVRLVVLLDILQVINNLSLLLQTVNVLPWELEDSISEATDLLDTLAGDLEKEDVSRTLPPTAHSQGKPVPTFEFTAAHLPELRKLKLSLPDHHSDDAVLMTVDLELSSARRASRGTNPVFAQAAGGSGAAAAPADANREITATFKELSAFCKRASAHLHKRLDIDTPDAEQRRLAYARKCLDLRKMAFDDGYVLAVDPTPALLHPTHSDALPPYAPTCRCSRRHRQRSH